MASSILLSQNLNNGLDGLNLKWAFTNISDVDELTLIYFKNSVDADIFSLDVSTDTTTLNLNLESGLSYSFQLQCDDMNGNTYYSNVLVLTSPYILSAPVIQSFVGKDNACDITLSSSGNSLTAQDSVEFVVKSPNNGVFWIIKPYSPSRVYTLSISDNPAFVNNQSYRVACMFQPSMSNAVYTSPSNMSNSLTITPSNVPNNPTSPSLQSVGVNNLSLQLSWVRPSDFAEWNDNFSIVVGILNYTDDWSYTTISNQDITTYTWSNLDREKGFLYSAQVKYVNDYGESEFVGKPPIQLTSKPDAPTLTSLVEGDGQMVINWVAPTYTGNSAITGYKVYQNSSGNNANVVATLTGDQLTYTSTNLINGVLYYFTVVAINAIGESAKSNALNAMPYGDCSISNVVMSGKTLTMTFAPNGRRINAIYIVALDANPSEDDVPQNFFYEVPTGSISSITTGTFNLTKTFSSFTDDISFYCVICNNSVSNAFLKSA